MTDECELWLLRLEQDDFIKIAAAIDALEERGPSLGRPYVDRITRSKHHNMKELRSIGGNIRVLFAFDPERKAFLLVGGDKTDRWTEWYDENVPIADGAYDEHLESLK